MKTIPAPGFSGAFRRKAMKAIILFSLAVFQAFSLLAQPVWVPGTPAVGGTTPYSITMDYGIDRVGTVYIIVFPYSHTANYPSGDVRYYALNPIPQMVTQAVIPVGAGDINKVLQEVLNVLDPNNIHTIYIVAESTPGGLQASPIRLYTTTAPCPKIDVLTGFLQAQLCVNKGAGVRFNVLVSDPDPDISGIYAGTRWFLDWGDGTTANFISSVDGEVPPLAMRQHVYTNISDCNYQFSNTILNPCGETRSVQYIAIVHGRDIPSDGDGNLLVVDAANGNTVIEICEGHEATVQVVDNSTWNCQNPMLPGMIPGIPNDEDRNIEWLYGINPAGGITNTITGDVVISNLGIANTSGGQASGRFAPSPMAPGELSEFITVPSTTIAGQYFRVYLKNWNKCNWTDPEYVDTYIDIVIIEAPDPPGVTSPQTYCHDGYPATISATPNSGTNTLNWYSDALLTNFLDSGTSLTHGKTTPGSYEFWVTETSGVNGCEGPPAYINLVIREELSRPGSISGPSPVCLDATNLVYSVTGDPPVMPIGGATEHFWTLPAGWSFVSGQGTKTITVNAGGTSGSRTISLVNRYTTDPFCTSDTRSRSITVNPLTVGGSITGGTTPLCFGSGTGNMTSSGRTGSIVQWEKRVNAGAWTIIASTANTYSEIPSSVGTWEYRVLVKSGACDEAYSSVRTIVVDEGSVGGSIAGGSTPICQGTNTGTMTLSGYTGSIVRWEKRVNAGGWTAISNTNNTYSEVPSSEGTWDYRAVVKNGACPEVNSGTRTIVVDPTTVGGNVTGGSTPICSGSATGTMTLSGHTGSVVRWEKRVNAGGWTVIANTNTTYSETPSSAGTWEYRAVVKSGTCAEQNSGIRTIIVDPPSVGGSIAGGSTPICQGTNTGTMTLSAHTGNIVRWEKRVNAGGWTSISNTSTTYSEIPSSAGAWDYRAVVKNGSCPEVNSGTRTIVVDPTTVGGNVTGGSTPICIGAATGTMTLSAHSGAVVRWEKRVNAGGWNVISNTNTTYSETPSSAGTWEYRAVVKSGTCPEANSNIRTIIVDPLTVGGSVSGGSTPICFGVSTGNMTLSGHAGNILKWQKRRNAGAWTDIANTTTSYVEVPSESGTWDYRAVLKSGSCPEVNSAFRTIIVHPRFQQAQLANDTVICNNSSADIRVFLTGGVSTYTVNYNKDGVPQAQLNGYVSGTNVSTGNLLSDAVYTLTSVTDANGCPVEDMGTPITVTVGSSPDAATLTGSGDACYGATSFIRSVITGGASPYVINYTRSGTAQAPINNYNSGTNFDLGVLNVGSYTYLITNIKDACLNDVVTLPGPYTINIDAIPDASATANNTPVLCYNGTTDIVLQSTVPSTNFAWTVAHAPAVTWETGKDPVAGSQSNGNGVSIARQLAHTGPDPVTVTYTITPTGPGATACPGAPITRQVVVNPKPLLTSTLTPPPICSGTAFSYVPTSATTGTSFAWTRATIADITPAGPTSSTGNPNEVLTNSATTPIAVTYAYTLTANGCTNPDPYNVVVIVNPSGQVNQPANQVVCNNGSTTAITLTTANTGGTTSYSWTNDTPGIGLPASGTGDIGAFTAVNAGTSPVTATIEVTPTFTNGTASCPGPSKTFTITVNPTGQVNQPANQVVCNNGSTTAITFTTANTVGTTSYSWTNDTPGIGLPASGTGNIGAFTATNSGTSPVTATIEVTPTFTNGTVSCPGPSKTFTITVNPTGQVNQPANQVVCNNGSTTAITFTTANTLGTTSYSWTNDTPGIGLVASGTGNIASFTAVNAGTSPVTATIVVTPTFTNGTASCPGPSKTFTITVNPTGQVNQPANQVVCNNSSTTAITFTTANTLGTTTYSWTNDTPGIGLVASGTGNIASFTAVNAGTSPVTATIVVTPTFTNGTVSCPGPSETFTITVNPTGQVNQPANQVVCNNSSTTAITFTTANTVGTTSYSWTNDTPGIGLPASGTGNIASFTAVNAGTSPVTATIVVTPTFTNGTVSCPGQSETFTITVNPTGQVNQPGNQVVCNNGFTTAITFTTANTVGTTSYSWTNNTPGIGLPASGTGNIGAFTATNTGSSPVTATIIVTPTFTNGTASCPGPTKSFTITVNPKAVINSAATKTVCNSTALDYTATSSTAGATFAWTRAEVTGISNLAGSGSTAYINESLTNTTIDPVDVIYVITPSYDGCPGTPFNLTVTVNPATTINSVATWDICNNTPLAYTATSTTSGATFAWTRAVTTGISNAAGSGSTALINESLQNTTTEPVNVEYIITPSYGGCPGTPFTLTVRVNPTAVVTSPNSLSSCENTVFTYNITSSTLDPALIFNWSRPVTAGISNPANSATGSVISESLNNTTTAPVNVNYTITPQLNGCNGTPFTLTVTVNPVPVIVPNSQTICSGNIPSIIVSADVAFTTFTWEVVNIAGPVTGTTVGNTGSGSAFTEVLTDTGSVSGTVTYRFIPTAPLAAGGCTGVAEDIVITVKPEPVISNQSVEVCSGNALDHKILLNNFLNPGDNVTFTWPQPVNDPGLTGGTARPLESSGNITDLFTNTTGLALSSVYTVTPYYDGCVGSTKDIVVTIGSEPVLDPDLNRFACSSLPTGLELKGAPLSVIPTWYNITDITVGPGLVADPANNPVPQNNVDADYLLNHKFLNETGFNRTVIYRVVPYFGTACVGAPVDVVVTIRPQPVILPGQMKTVCSNIPVNYEILLVPANTPANSRFNWGVPLMSDASVQGSAGVDVAADPLGTYHFTDILVNTSGVPITATYSVTPISEFSCEGTTRDVLITVNPEPAAPVITGKDKLCTGESNLVYDVPPVAGSTWAWTVPAEVGTKTFDFGTNAIIMNAALVPGSGDMTVIETNSYLCAGPAGSLFVEVFSPADQVIVAGENEVCAGDTETYTIPLNAGSLYSWSLPAGAAFNGDPSSNSISVTFGTLSGNVSVTEINVAGCVTVHNPLFVTVSPLPFATISPSKTNICDGENVTFTAGPAGAANYEFVVDGNTEQNGASNIFATGSLSDGQQVYVIITTDKGCVGASNPVTINVFPNPLVTLVSSDADNIICSGEAVTFMADAPGAATYNFFLNGMSVQNGPLSIFTTTSLSDLDEVYVVATTMLGCEGTSNTIVTTVNPLPAGVLSGDNTICPGTSTDLQVNITTGTGPYSVSISGLPDINNYNSNDLIPVSPSGSTTYTLQSVTDLNGCASTSPSPNLSGTATVNLYDDLMISVQPLSKTVCEGTNAEFVIFFSGSGSAVQWQQDNGGGSFADIADIPGVFSGTGTGTFTVINPDPSFDSYRYRAVVSGTCPPDIISDTVVLTVLNKPEITLQPVNVAVCEGDTAMFFVETGNTTNPVITWQTFNGSSWVPVSGAIYNSVSDDTLKIFGPASAFDGRQYRVVVSGSCAPSVNSNSVILTVYERPEITLQPLNVTQCEGLSTSFTINTGVTSSPAIQWEVFDNVSWQNASGAPYSGGNTATLTIDPVSSAMNGYHFRAVVGGTCPPAVTSAEAILTVSEIPEVTQHPLNVSECEGETVFFEISTGVTTNPSIFWQVSTDGGGVWASVAGAPYSGQNTTILTINGITSLMHNNLYRAVVQGDCTPQAESNPALLQVLEKPEVTGHPVDASECEEGVVTFTISTGVTTIPVISWEVYNGTLWAPASGVKYSGETSLTLTVSGIDSSMNNYRYRAKVEGTCLPAVYSDEANLVVYEKPEVTTDPLDVTICEDGNASFTISTGNTTDPSVQWQVSTNGGGSWSDVSGAGYSDENTVTLNVLGAVSSMNEYLYQAVVSGLCAGTVVSGQAELTVIEKPEIITPPAPAAVCEDGTALFNVDAGVTTNAVYYWEVNDGGAWFAASGIKYSGQGTTTLTVSNVSSDMSGNQYRVTVSGTCAPAKVSAGVALTVYEKPEIVGQPVSVQICENDNTSFSVDAGGTTVPVYTWEIFDGGTWNPVSGAVYSGIGTANLLLSNVPSSMNGSQFRVVITGTCTPEAISNVVVLTVNERPEVTVDPLLVTACENDTVFYSVSAGLTTDPVYKWQVFNGTVWSTITGGKYSGFTTDMLAVNNITSDMNAYLYRAIISGACAPNDTSATAALNVREKPEVFTQPVDRIICEGETTTFEVDAGVTTDPGYLWEVNDGGGWVTANIPNHAGYNTSVLTITSGNSAMDGNLYRVVISGYCSPADTSNQVVLNILEKAEIILQPIDTTVCRGANLTFSVNAGVTTNPVYQWQVSTDAGTNWANIPGEGNYLGVSGPVLSIFNADSAQTGYHYRAFVTGTCEPPDTSLSAILTVNTPPLITLNPESKTVCEFTATSFSTTAVGTTLSYQWQVDMTDGFGFRDMSDTATIYSGTTSNTLNVLNPARRFNGYRYRAVVTGTCAPVAYSGFAMLTVNTAPEIIDQPSPDTICEFNSVNFSVNAQGANLSFIWQESAGGGPFLDLMDTASYIGTQTPSMNIFNVPRTKSENRYRVIIQGTCNPPASTNPVELIVKTSPVVTVQPLDTIVCENNPAFFNVTAEGSDLQYQWQVSTGGSFSVILDGAQYSGVNTSELTVSDPLPAMNNYSYRAVVSGSCVPPVNSLAGKLGVTENPVILFDPVDEEICENGSVSFTAIANGPNLVYRWQVNSGAGFSDLNDNDNYSGTTTSVLSITDAPVSFHNNLYRLVVSNSCSPVNSAEARLTVNANPTANITGDGSFPLVCGGTDLNLDGNPAGGTSTYISHSWTGSIAPLSTMIQQQTVFNTLVHGTYNLTYTVTDDKNCKGSSSVVIDNDRPDARFISNAVPSCGYLMVDFTNQSERAVSYAWDFDDGSPLDNTESPSYGFENFDPTGAVRYYNVILEATSAKGCKDKDSTFVIIYPKVDPTFDIDPEEGCHPLVANLVSQPGAYSYEWDFGDGQQVTAGYAVVHEFRNLETAMKTYDVKLTTTSYYGCKADVTKQITVYPLPQPSFSVSPLIQTFPSATVSITSLVSTGPWSYLYRFGDGNTSGNTDPVHTYSEPGTFTITQIITSGMCVDSVKQTVIINPTPPIAGFVKPNPGCSPLQVQFSNTSLYATSYLWDFGDGGASTKRDPAYTYFDPGTYVVRLTVSGPGGSSVHQETIEIYETPIVGFSLAPDTVFEDYKPAKFFNFTIGSASYLWDFGDINEDTGDKSSQNTSTEYEPVHVYEHPGWKDVMLIAYNDKCSDTLLKIKAILVLPRKEFLFPTVFRPNPGGPSDGYYDRNDPNSRNSVFFPGVADDVLEYNMYIYNRWGELVFESNEINRGWDGYINKRMAAQGVYIWLVKGKYLNGENFLFKGDVTLLH